MVRFDSDAGRRETQAVAFAVLRIRPIRAGVNSRRSGNQHLRIVGCGIAPKHPELRKIGLIRELSAMQDCVSGAAAYNRFRRFDRQHLESP